MGFSAERSSQYDLRLLGQTDTASSEVFGENRHSVFLSILDKPAQQCSENIRINNIWGGIIK